MTNFGYLQLESFADDKLNAVVMMISLLDREKNTVGKEENAAYQHFHLFSVFFQSLLP